MSRRRLAVFSVAALGLVATGAGPAQAENSEHPSETPPGHRVVAHHLDNPRQLNWSPSGLSLIVAEAGRGSTGPDEGCEGEGEEAFCFGATGAVGTVYMPWRDHARYHRVVEGLLSGAGPDGAFAGGHTGADGVAHARKNEFVSVLNAGAPPGGPVTGLHYLVDSSDDDGAEVPAEHLLPGGDAAIPLVDLAALEAEQNPGGVQVESNPYAVVFHDPTPWGADDDGYALIADAAANTIWKVERDSDAAPPAGCEDGTSAPEHDDTQCLVLQTTVFHSWPDSGNPPEGATEEEVAEFFADRTPEFVPTSLAVSRNGYVWVGGLGSEVPGAGSVVQLNPAGELVQQWDGFTGVTGVAVSEDQLYVSQLFGATAPEPPGEVPSDEAPVTPAVPGSVVRTSLFETDAERVEVQVPFPAGLATDRNGNVYAAVNSIAPAEGLDDVFGPGSFDIEGGAVWQLDFSDAQPVQPPGEPGPAEPGPTGTPTDPEPTGTGPSGP